MTDTSDDDGPPPADPTPDGGDPVDAPPADTGYGTGDAESADPDSVGTESVGPVDLGDTADDDSPAVAVVVAVGLGVLGPAIALVGGLGVSLLGAVAGGVSLAVNIVLTLIVGQYVAFGGLAVGYLAWRGFDRAGIVSYLGVRRPSLKELGLVVGGWVVIVVTLFVVSAIVQLLGTETASNQSAEVAMQNPAIIPLFIVAMFLVVGPSEEILYRGVVQGRLRESLPAAPAIAIASGIFALIHVMALTGGLSGRLTTVGILFFPSLVFGAVYEYTDNLIVPALLHGLHNAVLFTILYVSIVYGEELQQVAEGGAAVLW
ncbi:MAG: putative metal-dependent membrane protease [uncultured archaeon A07HR67]|nr:MAG: putative metal-dependent membrane protease [uncultured archaeon A07HR67]